MNSLFRVTRFEFSNKIPTGLNLQVRRDLWRIHGEDQKLTLVLRELAWKL